jgi:hypothetical protein
LIILRLQRGVSVFEVSAFSDIHVSNKSGTVFRYSLKIGISKAVVEVNDVLTSRLVSQSFLPKLVQAEISSTRSALHEVKESLGGVRADLVQVGKERRMKWQ